MNMRGSLAWLVLIVMFFVATLGAPSPKITSTALAQGTHAYDVVWINGTRGFLLTNDGNGAHELFSSANGGQTWAKVALPGVSCYVNRIYVAPTDSTQIIFLGPPQGSCGWSSVDGGITYTPLSWDSINIQHISFNHYASGWALGSTDASEVYYTEDFGASWVLMEDVTSAAWALESDTKMSNLTMYAIKNGVFGYTYDQGASFISLYDKMLSLYTTSNFFYALKQDRTLLVGTDINQIQSAYFPFGNTVPMVFSVSDDVSDATWFFTDSSWYWGNVYTAGATGATYVESIEHVLKRDDAFLDFHSLRGLPGVHLANVVQNYNDYHDLNLKTYITMDNGGSWSPLTSVTGGNTCGGDSCSLNLHFNYKPGQRSYYTSNYTIGMVIANGYYGNALSLDNPIGLAPYISRDAGLTWQNLPVTVPGPYLFEAGSNGGILVLAPYNVLSNIIYYSLDEGLTLQTFTLTNQVYVTRILTTSTGNSFQFTIFTVDSLGGNANVYGVDFSTLSLRDCGTGDYENWAPSGNEVTATNCWLGQTVTYSRRIRTANCADTRGEQLVSSAPCNCTIDDYECDFGYSPTGSKSCIRSNSDLPPSPPEICTAKYQRSKGFRLVPGDKCTDGLNLKPETLDCPKTSKSGSSSKAWVAAVIILVVFVIVGIFGFIIYRDPELKAKLSSFLRIDRNSSSGPYGRVGRRSTSLAQEEDFGIQDDLLADGGEEDAKVLHDHEISKESLNKS